MTNFFDVRIYFCTTPTNMTYSSDRLLRRAQEIFEQDPLGRALVLVRESQSLSSESLVVGSPHYIAADDVITIINYINAHPGPIGREAPLDSISAFNAYVDVPLVGESTISVSASASGPTSASTINMSMADLVSLLATDISFQQAKRRRL